MEELNNQETELYRFYRGHIPEANSELNDLQQEKIAAIYEKHGKAYIGKINHYDDERTALTADTVFVEYTGQKVYNFEADFVVPAADSGLAELIVQWNKGFPTSLELISKITGQINRIGGANLMWS
jgi:hypothetical protein